MAISLLLMLASTLVAGCGPFGNPAAKFDGGEVSTADYQDRITLQEFLDKHTATQSPPAPGSPQERADRLRREDRVIQDLVDEALLRKECDKRHISVSDDDVKTVFDQTRTDYDKQAASLAQQGKTQPSFHDYLTSYGYTESSFKAALKNRLYEQRLENQLASTRAKSALNDLKAGGDITAVAKKWSDDAGSASRGGEAKFTPAQVQAMDAAVRPALEALQAGQTSSELARGASGYFLFKVIARDAAGVTFDAVQVTAPDFPHYRKTERPAWFQEFIAQAEKDAHIQYFVGSHTS
jgi:uncharacterized protein YkwD